ncbi:MAG: hypothetical protein GY847_23185 [Proteobacteria bacterium]|nr:hypothetical protein [Pseudomonadota bacterium]
MKNTNKINNDANALQPGPECSGETIWRGVGNSMLPFVLPGSRLYLDHRSRDGWYVELGDIICFINSDGRPVAHRVVETGGDPDARWYSVAGDTYGGREVVQESQITSVVTRIEINLFSYDTRSTTGRTLAGMAIDRSAPFVGLLRAALFGKRIYSLSLRAGIGDYIKKLLIGENS